MTSNNHDPTVHYSSCNTAIRAPFRESSVSPLEGLVHEKIQPAGSASVIGLGVIGARQSRQQLLIFPGQRSATTTASKGGVR